MIPSGENSDNVEMQSLILPEEIGPKMPRIVKPEDYNPKDRLQAVLMKRLKELYVHPMKYYIKRRQMNQSFFEYENNLMLEVVKAYSDKRRPAGYPLAIAIVFMKHRFDHIAEFENVEGNKVFDYTELQVMDKLKNMARRARKHGGFLRNVKVKIHDNTADEPEESSNYSADSSNASVGRRESGAGSSNMSIPADDDVNSMELENPEKTDRGSKNAQTTQNTIVEMQRKKEDRLLNGEDKMEVDSQGAFGHDESDMSVQADGDIIVMDHDNITRDTTGMQKENEGPLLNKHDKTVDNAPDAFEDDGNIYVYSPDLCTFQSVEAVLDYSPEMLIHGKDFEMGGVPTSALKLEHIAKDTEIIEKYRRTEDVFGGLNWFFKQKAMFSSIEFHADCISDESLIYFLMKIETQVNEAVTINARTSEHFKYTFRQPLEINLVYILQGTWVTVNNLYDMNSRHLHILGSNLTSKDMNSFLKNWLHNGNLSLIYLVVEMKLIDVDQILNGIDFERKEYDPQCPMRFSAQTAKVEYTLSYDIKLTESVTALIVMTPGENKLFQMCIRSIHQY
ncbi:hypothetical protein CAEBREN_19221 [Caenorhabditis brenneri]|uniref:Sdz-33 F-box domain-containing protein n=1 Tax=Caenorhabditis brenneri TaxID=135651 RepID=G0NSM4_CAEBE|nr:hypothetical protein CAEBREN_19221 [Caenorhabditis brenneri]